MLDYRSGRLFDLSYFLFRQTAGSMINIEGVNEVPIDDFVKNVILSDLAEISSNDYQHPSTYRLGVRIQYSQIIPHRYLMGHILQSLLVPLQVRV